MKKVIRADRISEFRFKMLKMDKEFMQNLTFSIDDNCITISFKYKTPYPIKKAIVNNVLFTF